jgi:hypothetical protein
LPQESLKTQAQHAREAVAIVKQQLAHVSAMATKAEEGASISEQSFEKFVRENTDRKQKLQDADRVAAATELLSKHARAHTEKDELLLQLQVKYLALFNDRVLLRCAGH